MKSSEILSKGIKNTFFSECVCSGTSCCCWVLHKMFFWASEIVSFILLRRLQEKHVQISLQRRHFGGFLDILMTDEQLGVVHLAVKHTFNGSGISEVKNSLFLSLKYFYIFDSLCSNKLDSKTSSWCSGDCDELCSKPLSDISKPKQPSDSSKRYKTDESMLKSSSAAAIDLKTKSICILSSQGSTFILSFGKWG